MSQPWHVQRPELLERMKSDVEKAFPSLRFVESGEKVQAKGSFPLSEAGIVLDQYQIEIDLPNDYPYSLPIVRETGGRIPRSVDRHVSKDGTLCVGLPDALWMDGTGTDSFLRFLEGPLRTFLLGNSLVEHGDPWPFGEWGHERSGVFQYYSELFATDDSKVVITLLDSAYRANLKGHLPCPCKSGKNFRRCHSPRVREIQEKVPRAVLERSLYLLLKDTSGENHKTSPKE